MGLLDNAPNYLDDGAASTPKPDPFLGDISPDADVKVISPKGEPGTIKASALKDALGYGFRVLTPEVEKDIIRDATIKTYVHEHKGLAGDAQVAL